MSLRLQRTTPVCPARVRAEAAVWRPVRVSSAAAPPGGPGPPAPTVRPPLPSAAHQIPSEPPLTPQWTFSPRLRCGRVPGEPLQTRRGLPGPGQRLQVHLSASVDRKDLPHRSVPLNAEPERFYFLWLKCEDNFIEVMIHILQLVGIRVLGPAGLELLVVFMFKACRGDLGGGGGGGRGGLED